MAFCLDSDLSIGLPTMVFLSLLGDGVGDFFMRVTGRNSKVHEWGNGHLGWEQKRPEPENLVLATDREDSFRDPLGEASEFETLYHEL